MVANRLGLAARLGVMYNTRMERKSGILRVLIWLTLSTGSASFGQSGASILIYPFEPSDGSSKDALALTLSLYDTLAHVPQIVAFPRLRAAMKDMDLPPNVSTTLATRIVLARNLGANVIMSGRLSDARVSVFLRDLEAQTTCQRTWDRPDSDAAFCVLARDIAGLLGTSWESKTTPSDDFYRVWASTYSPMPQDIAGNVFRKLLEHHSGSLFLFSEFHRRFDPPSPQDMEKSELVFWRDLFVSYDAYAESLPFSSRLLKLTDAGDAYGMHAVILSKAGNHDMACRYLKMALAYGAAPARLIDLGASCGVDLTAELEVSDVDTYTGLHGK